MSPVAIKPVSINSGQQSFRALAMPKWAPLGQQALFNKKRMGQKRLGQSASDDVAKNIGMGVISAAGVYIGSKLLPSAWGVLAMGAGLIGIMYSLNNLVGGDEKDGAPPKAEEGTKIASEEDYKAIRGAFLSPKMYETIDPPGPNWYWSPTRTFFDVDIVFEVTNPSAEYVDVTLRFVQKERATKLLWFDSEDTVSSIETVRVPAKSSKKVEFQIDTQNWAGSLSETITAEKVKNGVATKLAEVTFFI